MTERYSVFISAVSREFRQARDRVANALQARGLEVRVQRSFRQGSTTTLEKLHDYIKNCHSVVAVIGAQSGAFPPDASVTPEFSAMLPSGMDRASMTQWEVLFAQHYGRHVLYYEGDEYPAEQPPGEGNDPSAQSAWHDQLFDGGQGLDRAQFSTIDGLLAAVLAHDWPVLKKIQPQNLPFTSIGHLFKGRSGFLSDIRKSFKNAGATAITATAAHGLGGIGKTRAAVEYALANAADYDALLYIPGKSKDDLESGLAALVGPLVLNLPEQDAQDIQIRITSAINWLRSHDNWFLLIDNVDSDDARQAAEAMIAALASSRGHVLITSRVSTWQAGVTSLKLDVLAQEDAVDLLMASTPRRKQADTDAHDAIALAAEDLDRLSLALVQAAAYIDQRRISFAEYRALLGKNRLALLEKYGPRYASKLNYPLPVATTWLTTVEQLSQDARFLLNMLSFFSVEPIPDFLLDAWDDDAFDIYEALDELEDYSLVNRSEDGEAEFTVHRLVQEVTRERLEGEERFAILSTTYSWLYYSNPEWSANDIRCWPIIEPLKTHASKAIRFHLIGENYQTLIPLMLEYARLDEAQGRLNNAESIFRDAQVIQETLKATETDAFVETLNSIGSILESTEHYEEAEKFYLRAMDITNNKAKVSKSKQATILNNLAYLYMHTNRSEKALPLYNQALEIFEETYGNNHPNVATTMNNIAFIDQKFRRLKRAESLYK